MPKQVAKKLYLANVNIDENTDLDDDDDDDDDDFLTEQPTFVVKNPARKSRKRKRTISAMLKDVPMIADSSSTSGTTVGASMAPKRRKPNPTTETQTIGAASSSEENTEKLVLEADSEVDLRRMEERARKSAMDLDYDAIVGVNDFSQLGFVKEGKKNRVFYTPAVLENPKKAEILKNQKLQKSKTAARNVPVRILGLASLNALDYMYIRNSHWVGLSGDGCTRNEEDERRLQTYLKFISCQKVFTDNVLELKTEEFVIREYWKRVRAQQDNHGGLKDIDEDKKPAASTSGTNRLTAYVTQDSQDEGEGTDTDNNQITKSTASKTKSETEITGSLDSAAQSSDSDDDDDEDNRDDDHDAVSGVSCRRMKQIRVGDMIEFTDPIGTAGDPRWLRQTKVLGIRIKGGKKCIIFNSPTIKSLTNLDHPIRLIGVTWRRKYVSVDGTYKSISSYSLKSGGIQDEFQVDQELIAKGQRAVKEIEAHQRAWLQANPLVDTTPTGQQDQTTNNDDMVDIVRQEDCSQSTDNLGTASNHSDKTRPELEKDKVGKTVIWFRNNECELKKLREMEEERMRKSRRHCPRIPLEKLDFLLDVCRQISTKASEDDTPVSVIFENICDKYEIPDNLLENLLIGDPQKKLQSNRIESCLESLSRWMEV